jgi:hypothetical protein
MKRLLCASLAVVAAVVFCAGVYAANQEKSVVRHVVMFKFKEGTAPEKIKEIEQKFAELPTKLDIIKDFEWGTNISPEKLNKGFTHCFVVTFADEAGRDAYLPSKPHQDFVAILGPVLEEAMVIDYKARK